MKNAAQDTFLHFAIENTIMDLLANGATKEEVKQLMAERHPKVVDRVRYYMEMVAYVKAQIAA